MNTEPQGDRFTFEIGFILSLTLIIIIAVGSCSVERMAQGYFDAQPMIPATVEEEK